MMKTARRMAMLMGLWFLGVGGAATAQRPDISKEWAKVVEARDALVALETTPDNLKQISISTGTIRVSTWKLFEEIYRQRFFSQDIPVDVVEVFDTATMALERQRAILEAGLAGTIELTERPSFISAHEEDAIREARHLIDSPAENAAYRRMAASRWAVYEAYVALRDARGWPIRSIILDRHLSNLQHISPTGEIYAKRAIQLIERWTAQTDEADRATLDRDLADSVLDSRWNFPGEGSGRCFTNPAVEELTTYLSNHPSPLLRILGEQRRLHDADEAVRHAAAIRLLDVCFPLTPYVQHIVLDDEINWIDSAAAKANYALGKDQAESWLNQRIDHALRESDARCFLVYPQATLAILRQQRELSNLDSPDGRRLREVTRDDRRTDAAGRVGTYAVMLAILRDYEPAVGWEEPYRELVGKLTTQIKGTIAIQNSLDPETSPWESGEIALRRIEYPNADRSWGVPFRIAVDPDPDAAFPITLLFSNQNLLPPEQRFAPERTVHWVLAQANLIGEIRFMAETQTLVERGDLTQSGEIILTPGTAAIFHRQQLTVLSEAGPFVLAIENEAGRRQNFRSMITSGPDIYIRGDRYVGRIDIEHQLLRDFLPQPGGAEMQIEGLGQINFYDAALSSPNITGGDFLALKIEYRKKSSKRRGSVLCAYDPQSQQFIKIDSKWNQTYIHDGKLYRTRDKKTQVYEHTSPVGTWREVTTPRPGVVDDQGKPLPIREGYTLGRLVLFQPRQGFPTAATPNGTVFRASKADDIDLGYGKRLDESRYVGFIRMNLRQWEDPASRIALYLIEAQEK